MASSTDPLTRSKGGKSSDNVRSEPFQHLIQQVKQVDPMLYEALRRIGSNISNISDVVNRSTTITTGGGGSVTPPLPPIDQDRATFGIGIGRAQVIGDDLTNHFMASSSG